MNIEFLRKNNLIIYECISGSKAYGLATEKSDTDIKGVFIAPKKSFYGFIGVDQVSNETNDIIFYEIKKFLTLLNKNNPNILEMLYTSADCVLFEDPLFTDLRKHNFLSKLCLDTFVGYANGQIIKAKGLNKKLVNPMQKERLPAMGFCHVTNNKGSLKLADWLQKNEFDQSNCGLSGLPHFSNMYLIYHSKEHSLRGIFSKTGTEIRTSSIPKTLQHLAYFYFNADAFNAHCERHKNYWSWAKERNAERYETNIAHGKAYDSKNMMHVFRLLDIAEDIATNQRIDLISRNREFLMQVKLGAFEYNELIAQAQEKSANLDKLFMKSDLPNQPDTKLIERLLIHTRNAFYVRP